MLNTVFVQGSITAPEIIITDAFRTVDQTVALNTTLKYVEPGFVLGMTRVTSFTFVTLASFS